MKKILVICLLLFIPSLLNAQDENKLPEIVPPSPEATSLGKFVDIPVSMYSGLPNINIPIYKIDLDGQPINISLSYFSKGIRVEEVASRVGLGWALNGGGLISRQIRGSADDNPSGDMTGYLDEDFYEDFFRDDLTGENARSYVYSKVELNTIDLYPDQFMFNFLGYSGKFIIDQKTKLPIIQNFSDLEIKPLWSSGAPKRIEGWTVRTPEGFKAYFGISKDALRFARDQELVLENCSFNGSLSCSSAESSSPYTSWYLMDLISPKGNSVLYKYNPEEPVYVRRKFDEYKAVQSMPVSYFSKVRPTQYQLSEIQFKGGKVEFISESDERLDLDNAYALDKIRVIEGASNAIKTIDLSYIYTTSSADGNVLGAISNLDLKAEKRLILDKVQRWNASQTESIPPYKFYYKNINSIPHRFSNSQDNWGYFNNEDNGYYLTFFDYGSTTVSRQVDTIQSQVGLLEKIEYPTGGFDQFYYEQNRAIPPNYFSDLIYSTNNPSSETKNGSLLKAPEYYNGSYYESNLFTIGENQVIGDITSNISITPSEGCDPYYQTSTCEYSIELYSAQNSYMLNIGEHTISVPPGDYRIKVTPRYPASEDPNDFDSNTFWVNISWVESETSESELLYTSGNRIKKIVSDDQNGNSLIRKFKYTDESGLSTGKVFSLPSYYFEEVESQAGVVINREYGARPGSPLTYEQGHHEGYSQVTEYKSDGVNTLGKSVFKFTTIADGGTFYEFPYTLSTDNEWLRGKPLKESYFSGNSGSYELIKTIDHTYRYADVTSSPSIFSFPPRSPVSNSAYNNTRKLHVQPLVVFADEDGTPGDADEYNEYKEFFLTAGTQDIEHIKKTTYYPGQNLDNETQFFFDYENHYQVDRSENYSSNGMIITEEFVYPQDVKSTTAFGYDNFSTSELDAIEIMNRTLDDGITEGLNMVSKPIQTEIIKEDAQGTIVARSAQRNIYRVDGGIVSLNYLESSKSGENLEKRIQFNRYDSNGNPLEVKKVDGPSIVYIWGYNDQQPIAKIENATYAEVASALGISVSTLDTYDEGNLSAINALRINSALDQAMITTYTYQPLVGVTSITDPKDQTTTYHYDNFNRLEFIKDGQGRILKEYKYNYKQ